MEEDEEKAADVGDDVAATVAVAVVARPRNKTECPIDGAEALRAPLGVPFRESSATAAASEAPIS